MGKSGIKKGLPVSLATKLVERLNCTRVISGRSSIQAIIDVLGSAESAKDGTIHKSAHGFIVSGEFSQSILEDPQALTILTNLYNTHEHEEGFKNILKSGKSILKEVYVTLLGASNETHLNAVITQRDVMGGFVARVLMVNEHKGNKKNSLVYKVENPINIESLLEHLRGLLQVKGEFIWDPEAARFYDEWYQSYEPDDTDDTGTANRITDTILKIAMLLSLARDYNLILTKADVEKAIELCFECYPTAKRIQGQAKDINIAELTKHVLRALVESESHELSRTTLLKRFYQKGLFVSELDKIVDVLLQSRIVTQETRGNQIVYSLTERALRELAS